MPGTLFLVPTRLGEAGDWPGILPEHTRETVCRLRHFIVENAKTARADLKWAGHPGPLRDLVIEQLPSDPTVEDYERLLSPLGKDHDIGLMSEAGCPGVADPGAILVRRAHAQGITVRPLVGPSSLLLALMASGLDGQRFAFHGYLPAREPERSRHIVALEKESRQKRQTQLFIETPYRNTAMLDALLAHCQPTTLLCVAAELTQPGETIATRSIAAWQHAGRPDLNRRPTVYLLLSAD